jgi:hypothetical protein
MVVNPGSVGSPGYRDVHPFPRVMEAGTSDGRYAIQEFVDSTWRANFRHVPSDHDTMAVLARRNGPAGACLRAGDGMDSGNGPVWMRQ